MPSPQADSAAIFVRAKPLAATTVDDELVMMDIDSGHYITLNATGARVWELIEQPRPLGDICAILTQRFNISDQQCLEDVSAFLATALAQGLVARA